MNQRNFPTKFLVALVLVIIAVIANGQANAGNVLRLVTPYDVSTLDPIKSANAGDITILGQVHARLLRSSPDGSELLPGLAQKWESSPDGITHTFHLRDARFSDGSPITADDVVFSFLRLRDQEDSAYGGAFQVIDKIEALDKKTAVFTLKAPAAPFIGSMEMFNAGIVPKDVVKKVGDDMFSKAPVGAGPFRVKEWKVGDRVILERNPYYWRKGLPYLDGIEWVYVSDDHTRVSMILANEADVVLDIPWNKIDEFKAKEGIKMPLNPSSIIYCILLNHKTEPFKDVRVRRAFAHAVNAPSMVKAVCLGHSKAANSPLPNTLNYYNLEMPAFPHDPQKAKELLKEAGKSDLKFELMTFSGAVFENQVNIILQAQLAAIGVQTSILKVDQGQWWDRIVNGNYTATVTWWYNETTDPDQAVRWAFCGTCGNQSYYTGYNNEKVNELIEKATRETNSEMRRTLYHEIQKTAQDEVSQIALFYVPFRHAYRSQVKGLMMNPAIQFSLDQAKLTE